MVNITLVIRMATHQKISLSPFVPLRPRIILTRAPCKIVPLWLPFD